MKLYMIHVQRVVRLRLTREWTVGPVPFRWLARFIAWWYTQDHGDVWWNSFVVETS